MKRYQAFVGKTLVVLPLTRWQAERDGTPCVLEPGEYLITAYEDNHYTIRRDDIDYWIDADTVVDRGYILATPIA